jgi:hypothetical protein
MEGTANTTLIVLFVLVAFPIVFSALWIGITLVMSFIGGWRVLSEHYAASGKPAGFPELRRVTGMFGVASYKHVLTVITTDQGLYIANRTVFRFGHPPLFIPFSAIVDARRQTLFFWDYVAFDVGSPPIASIRLPLKVFEGTPVEIAP